MFSERGIVGALQSNAQQAEIQPLLPNEVGYGFLRWCFGGFLIIMTDVGGRDGQKGGEVKKEGEKLEVK